MGVTVWTGRNNQIIRSCSSATFGWKIILSILSYVLVVVTELQLYSSVARCESYEILSPLPSTKTPQRVEIQPKQWEYKSRYEIGYEIANVITTTNTESNNSNDENSYYGSSSNNNEQNNIVEPILLLNGFGVGSFHQHRLVNELLTVDDDDTTRTTTTDGTNNKNENHHLERTIYCMDYLGQGRSWPKDCQDGCGVNEKDLQYSADTWCEQIIDFIEEIILPSSSCSRSNSPTATTTTTTTKKVHLVGNSVGGHLAAHVAVRRPDLVESLCLLNPTPVWGSKLPGWDGHLPAPAIPKLVGRYLFDQIRDLKTIEEFLTATYSRREAFSDELMHQIRGCTLGNGGHAAFASIMWSKPLISKTKNGMMTTDYYDCLSNVSCDVLLGFGKDDPWCKPAFAKSMLLALEGRKKDGSSSSSSSYNHRYVEISNAGHCPNHEAPKAVSSIVKQWINNNGDRRRSSSSSSSREKEEEETVTTANNRSQTTTTQQQQQQVSVIHEEEWGDMTITERNWEDIEVGFMDKIVTMMM